MSNLSVAAIDESSDQAKDEHALRRWYGSALPVLNELKTVRSHAITISPCLKADVIGDRVLPLAGTPIKRFHGALTVAVIGAILRNLPGPHSKLLKRFASTLDMLDTSLSISKLLALMIKVGLGASVPVLYSFLIGPVALSAFWVYGPRSVVDTIAQGWEDYVRGPIRRAITFLTWGYIDLLYKGTKTTSFIGYIPPQLLHPPAPAPAPISVSRRSSIPKRNSEVDHKFYTSLHDTLHRGIDESDPAASFMHDKIPILLAQMRAAGGASVLEGLEQRIKSEGAMHTLRDELANTLVERRQHS